MRTLVSLKSLAFGTVIASSLMACSGPPDATEPEESRGVVRERALATRVVGYFPSWKNNIGSIQYDKLTHLNYAFLLPTAQGGVTGLSSADGQLKTIVQTAHARGVKVLISVGGWMDGNDSPFEQLAANATTRTTFINNVVNFVNAAGLDGADIDWEYPDPGTSGQNYEKLMQELGTRLHAQGKLLTAAVVANGYTGGGISTAAVGAMDFVNIMAYDGGTPHSTYTYANDSLNYWLGRGVPKQKAVLGVPFYGRSTSEYVGYADLVKRDAQAPYKDQVGQVYYNGLSTIQSKSKLALANGGGVMIWDISDDTSDGTSLLSAIAQAVGGGTTQPTTPKYRLVNKATGKCVDIAGPNSTNGSAIHQWTCHTGTSQQWTQVTTDSGYVRFVSVYNGKVLDIADKSTADGGLVQQWDWSSGTNQQFKAISNGNGYYRLEARHSAKVLDVTSCTSSGDGTRLQQWTWSNNDCQQFKLEQL